MVFEDLSDVFAYHGAGAPERAANMAIDPMRVYYLGAGRKPCHAPGAPLSFSNETLPQTTPPWSAQEHARRSEAGPR
jgi:hypothetical protein